jgi:ankyrin repeat protein
MKCARGYSVDNRIPDAEKLLDLCTESFGCDGSVVDMIASEGINMDVPMQQSRTPLMGAILNRNFEIASALIQHGADIHAMWTPIYPDSPDKRHPDVNILFEYLTTNLDTALAPLRYLLEPLHSRPDSVPSFIVVPSERMTALHIACKEGNPLIVEYLLSRFSTSYHLNFINEGGLTSLHFAVFHGHSNIARMLVEKGARADIPAGNQSISPESRRNALDYCHFLASPDISTVQQTQGIARGIDDVYLGRIEISKMLKRKGLAVRTAGSADDEDMVWSVKLCLYAAQNSMVRLLKVALEDLRNSPEPDRPWQVALDLFLRDAALLGQPGSAKLLIEYGANVNQVLPESEAMTILHQVVAQKDAEMVYLLLRAGANVDAYDDVGRTPLSYALQSKDWRTCRVLKHFNGTLTLERSSMAQILVRRMGISTEVAMAMLQDNNIHMVPSIGEECSDDGSTGGSDAPEAEIETDIDSE